MQLMVPEKFTELTNTAPQTLADNSARAARAKTYGESLLKLYAQSGVTDKNYAQGVEYLQKVRKTVAAMNEARKPITQFLTEIAKQFTSLESELEAKGSSIPAQIQKHLNDYAAEIARIQVLQQAQAERVKQVERAKIEFEAALERLAGEFFLTFVRSQVELMRSVFDQASLDDFDEITAKIQSHETPTIKVEHLNGIMPAKSPLISDQEAAQIKAKTIAALLVDQNARFSIHYNEARVEIEQSFDKRYQELNELFQADENQKAELEAQIKAEQTEKMIDQERKLIELSTTTREHAEINKSSKTIGLLFEAPAEVPAVKINQYTELKVTGHAGWMALLIFYFENEGKTLAEEQLEKKLGFMRKFAENHFNKNEVKVDSPYLKYTATAKAK